jgi:hypothetical protein
METTVKITWDTPEEQGWLCSENIKLALSAYCKNTKFEVEEIKIKYSVRGNVLVDQTPDGEPGVNSNFTHPPVHCENGERLYFDKNAKLL